MKSTVVGVSSLSFLTILTYFTNGLYMSFEIYKSISYFGRASFPSQSMNDNSSLTGPQKEGRVRSWATVISRFLTYLEELLTN